MGPFDLLVDRDHELAARLGEHRGVVADRELDRGRRAGPERPADPGDELLLAGAGLHAPAGRLTTNTAPRGEPSSMWIEPSWASTSRLTIERPRPVPPYSRVDDESTW